MKQAIIYCRFSPRPNSEDCTSNDRQEERCRDYCKRKEYNVIDVFSDYAKSGKTKNRPALKLALDYLADGMILVVDTHDRLARDMLVSLMIHAEVEGKGARVESADGNPTRVTPEGRLVTNVLAAFAQYQRETFAIRTKKGLARKKAEGIYLGTVPIGYKRNPKTKTLEEDYQEQTAIRTAIELSKQGVKSEKIAALLSEHIGPCRGRPWSGRTVRKLLNIEKIT